jgi:hypothetical protein
VWWLTSYYNFTIQANTTLGWCIIKANMTTTNVTNSSGYVWYSCPYGVDNSSLKSTGLNSWMNWTGFNLSNTTSPPYCSGEGLAWVNGSLNMTWCYNPGMSIDNIPYWVIVLLGFGTLAVGWRTFTYYGR